MVPTTQSDNSTALEHILTVILSEPLPPAGTSSNPPFCACLAKVGISKASDFVSLEPSDYGIITFAVEPSGPEDQSLSLIQVKKIKSLFSWFHQVSSYGVSRWLDLDYSSFQAWRSLPTSILQGASPASVSLPSSDYQVSKEDRLWHSWHQHLLTTAQSHNVDNVLNLSYSPTNPDDIALLQEQKRFVFSVLEQKVLTSDGTVFTRVHSTSGDATAVYKNLVEHYSKSTAAQLSASEIKEDLSTFHLSDTWKKSNLMFLNAWATKILDLDLVLIQATSESERICFTRAIAPKLILSMSISQFEASEKLTGLAFGPSYQKAPFSTLFDHVKDDVIRLDQTERLLQAATCHEYEANTKTKEGKPPLAASASSTPSDTKVFLGRDGKHNSYLIPPDVSKKMTAEERKAVNLLA
jgi:hypothetical protein